MTTATPSFSQPAMSRADITRLLDEQGLKPTAQRLDIAELLMARPTHMTAEQILSTLREAGQSISKATVYNTLNALVNCGLIKQIHLDPDRSVYDSTRVSHHHFYDVESGALWDIEPKGVQFSHLPPLPEGMETASIEVVVRIRRKPAI
jgi:Fur family transcriptional regulator, iron response regulator